MTVEIYGADISPFCRNVYMTLDVLNVPYKNIETIPFKGDTRTPEYLKMNPQHNIPTVKDGDFIMNESRAIMTYFASKQGCTKLYPTDIKVRARVDQRLYFEMGSFIKSIGGILAGVMFEKKKPTEEQFNAIKENLGWLNDFVKPTGYSAGTDHITVADLAFLASYTTLLETGLVDVTPYSELPAWVERVKKEIPNYEKSNGEGVKKFGEFFKSKAQEIGL